MKLKTVQCNTENHPKLVKLLELLSHYSEPHPELEAFRTHYIESYRYKRVKVSRDYSLAAQRCLISHRFGPAATMLDVLCQEPNFDNVFFYKAASLVLENSPSSTHEDFFHFIRFDKLRRTDANLAAYYELLRRKIRHVISLSNLNKREVVLEYLTYSLKNRDLDGQLNVKALVSRLKKNILKNFIIDPLLKAYLGIYDYIDWAKNREGGIHNFGAKTSAEKAIKAFQEVINIPGQWDIFIIKLVEMLDFYNQMDEIKVVLKKYVQMNPEHLNSHLYLCFFYDKYQPNSHEFEECLTTVAKCYPFRNEVCVLANMIKKYQPERALKLIFLFLDYPCNTNVADAWCLLLDLLKRALRSQSPLLLSIMNACWENRKDVWPYLHFNEKNVSLSNDINVNIAISKGVVFCVFVEDHSFFHFLLDKLPGISEKHFVRFIRRASYIDYLKNNLLSEGSDSNE